MKLNIHIHIGLLLACSLTTATAIDRFVSLDGGHVPPFTSWADAATNIQAAIDAASAGDTVWVTNGVYASGGKVMAGDLTNRVALDKAVAVQSVNGPAATIIQGQWDPTTTNGPLAVRCSWLTNGATLRGFTILGGATRTEGDVASLLGGGGVLCSSSNSVVENCRITSNAAMNGGGASGGTLVNCQIEYNTAVTNGGGAYSEYIGGANSSFLIACEITGNAAVRGGGTARATLTNCKLRNNRAEYGGGAYAGTVINCGVFGNSASVNGGGLHGYSPGTFSVRSSRITGNSAKVDGGGVYAANSTQAYLNNCTITGNSAGANGGGTFQGTLRNCIIWFNTVLNPGGLPDTYNTSSSAIQYSCMSEGRAGTGNLPFTTLPQFLADGWHLSSNSPCRAAGSAASASGTDFDGQAWANPPSMGCDEWRAEPAVSSPIISPATRQAGRITISGFAAGQEPFGYLWLKAGTALEDGLVYAGCSTANLTLPVTDPSVAGVYQLVVTNSFGAFTSGVARVSLSFVDISGSNPIPPYGTWATAAINIQDAIDVAQTGDVVVVTNGIYGSGGRVLEGLTNRIMLYKPIIVQSVNGPSSTTIQGAWHPGTTNGATAVRCAWLENGAGLGGFTVRGGATLSDAASVERVVGGGIRCMSTNAVVANCWIMGNAAFDSGGGAYSGALVNCVLSGNFATGDGGGASRAALIYSKLLQNFANGSGGGAHLSTLHNCAVLQNYARLNGGGTRDSTLMNCTVTANVSQGLGGGVQFGSLRNCIVQFNTRSYGSSDNITLGSASAQYTCSSPLPSGIGNIDVNPGFMADGFHLTSNSPCSGKGSQAFAGGTDFDGQNWASPPSMGCDEWQPTPVVIVHPTPRPSTHTGQVRMSTVAAGQPPFGFSWSKDGSVLTNTSHYADTDTADLQINEFGVGDAGAYQVVVSNAFGVVTSQLVQVTVHCVDPASALPAAPFTSWGSAATAIQDAVDVAGPADVVLVTNGVYASGGRTNSGALTNRVVLSKPLLVTSVEGPDSTIIEGQWDPASTNGPSAVRCAWLGDGAALSGFTLRNGATTAASDYSYDSVGGGALCSSINAELANCIITNCRAKGSGGGVYSGLVRNSRLAGNSVTTASGVSTGGGAAASSTLINSLISQNTSAIRGGGVRNGRLYNCFVDGNTSAGTGGGVDGGVLINCTVTANTSTSLGGGVSGCYLTNCIVYLNSAPSFPNVVYPLNPYFTCSTPLLAGTGNISDDPQLTDGWHLAATSPCRGMGIASAASGTDLDGDPWANPPSMGCDEVNDATFVGPLSVTLSAAYPEVAAYGSLPLFGQVSGRASKVEWSFGEGTSFTNLSALTFHAWTNPGDYLVTFTAYNTDNPAGVSTSMPVHVVPLVVPLLATSGWSSNNFTLSFPGQAGITYVVEQATNLAPPVTWQTVQALISTGAVIQVTDTKATNAMRFYRTRRQ